MPIWLLVISILSGWGAGGLANWATDHLPVRPEDADSPTPAWYGFTHYWTLTWYGWRSATCPDCQNPRPVRAVLLEGGCILGYVLASWRFQGDWLPLLIFWLYLGFFAAVAAIDFEHRRVLNVMLLPAALAALAFSFLPGTPQPLMALAGGAIGFGLFFVIALLGPMGGGDVKLAGVIGLMIGFPGIFDALVIGVILGGVAALFLFATRRITRRSTMAYAPYLALGALISLWRWLG